MENNSITDSKTRHDKGNKLKELISSTRDHVNNALDNRELKVPHYMDTNDLSNLDMEIKIKMIQWRKELGESNYYNKLSKYVYDAISNGITYDNGKVYKIK